MTASLVIYLFSGFESQLSRFYVGYLFCYSHLGMYNYTGYYITS